MAGLEKRASVDAEMLSEIVPAKIGERGYDPEEDFEKGLDEETLVAEGKAWREQFSIRAMFVGILTGILLIFISLTIGLSGAGVSPGYSVTASLIGYAIMKPLTSIALKFVNSIKEFNRQENCIIQATATSIQSLVHALGVSSWLWGLHENVAAQLDLGIETFQELEEAKKNGLQTLPSTVNLSTGSMIGIAFLISFTGVLIVTVFKKMFIVDVKLPFPSPTATAVMINSLFTKAGRDLADRQLKAFKKWSGITFLSNLITYLFTRNGCPSFNYIPLFGLEAYRRGWWLNIGNYINFVGVGMIMSPNVSYSLVLGAVISYGIWYPQIYKMGGYTPVNGTLPEEAWFDYDVGGMDGFYGYKVMMTLMILLGDGLFALCLMSYIGISEYWKKRKGVDTDTPVNETEAERMERINTRIFTEDDVPVKYVAAAYLLVTIVGVIALPVWFKVPWYMLFVAFMLTPIFALVGNYIAGLTDWNVTSNFAKAAALIFGAWGVQVDPDNAILISLLCCGIVYCGASNSTDIIGDFKTGYLTRTSPRGMLFAQLIGFSVGCIFTPIIFNLFIESAPDTGFPASTGAKYPNTYGTIYRAMARLSSDGGFDALPKNCLLYSMILFAISFVSPILKLVTLHVLEKNGMQRAHGVVEFIWPTPMAVGIPFLVGTFFVLPVGIGLVINEIWKYRNRQDQEDFYQIVAAGLLVGPGLWSIPELIITLAGGEPPLCMDFGRDGTVLTTSGSVALAGGYY